MPDLPIILCSQTCTDDPNTDTVVTFLAKARELAVARSVNLNAVGYTSITVPSTAWIPRRIFLANPSAAATSTIVSVFSQAAGAGDVLVDPAPTPGLTGTGTYQDLTISLSTGDSFSSGTASIYINTPAGVAATADIFIEYDELNVNEEIVQTQEGCCPRITYINNAGMGQTGPAGEDGEDGIDAFTALTAGFVMPAQGANVAIDVAHSEWMVPGQIVYIQFAGYFTVASVPTIASAIITNPNEDYDNTNPGTNIPNGAKVGPGGKKGIDGDGSGVTFDSIAPGTLPGQWPVRDAGTYSAFGPPTTNLQVLTTNTAQAQKMEWATLNFSTFLLAGTLAIVRGGTGAATASAAFQNLSILSVKGDFLSHNGTDSIRVAVGANDTVPVADSTQAAGWRWGAPVSAAVLRTITLVDASPYNMLVTDDLIEVDLTVPGATAIFLPSLASITEGRPYTYKDAAKNAGTNAITITPFGAETIEGAANFVIGVNGGCVTLYKGTRTTDWKVLH